MLLPLISVCIPTFNGAEFLKETLDSISIQTYENLEVIISDDESEDKTLEIIEDFKKTSKIPVHIYKHIRSSIGANWNNCIKKANGEFIKFIFQDDLMEPACISSLYRAYQINKSAALVACKREILIEDSILNDETRKWKDEYGDLQKNLELKEFNGLKILNKKIFKSDFLFTKPLNKVGEPSVTLFPKKIIDKIGYFREDLKQNLDYEFYYRLLKRFDIVILGQSLVKFRIHSEQATQLNKNNNIDDYRIFDKIIYKEYFWFLNRKKQIEYLKKYNLPFQMLLKIRLSFIR
ncbi:glycosyltransferase family 2 protein [Gramella sp. BOM4]|nr:glycosyltransferase family 2 protein [Christiangramia bathymodioli]